MSTARLSTCLAIVTSGLLLANAGRVMAQQHEHAAVPRGTGNLEIPGSLRVEHAAIHEELQRATRAPGRVGLAARRLALVLHPHFVREEQIALPPLGLLLPLSREAKPAGMTDVLPIIDSLRLELPRMLEEHRTIREATLRLLEAARAARNTRVARLAEELALHARTEEEVLYPAAVLVGELVRGRLGMGVPR